MRAFGWAVLAFGILATGLAPARGAFKGRDPRVERILSLLTPEEKIAQLMNDAPAVERAGLAKYNWWNESLHGVVGADYATLFPAPIALGATWDPALIRRIATAIGEEARAIHHEALRKGRFDRGLTLWAPNINILRDPRWGRGHETYGEDPFLTATLAVEYVRGLQGDHPKYLRTVATPKHFAVHSGPEKDRHSFDARVSAKDLRETYLPAFEASVREGGAYSIMGAYNRVNGAPACASPELLEGILRREWGFQGYVVSDCGAIGDIHFHHRLTRSLADAASRALAAGCDLECGTAYSELRVALKEGRIRPEDLDRSLRRLLEARARLGMLAPAEDDPYSRIPYSVVNDEAHRKLALEAAEKSLVLLKNRDRALPLSARAPGRIAVVGPTADEKLALLGNYAAAPRSWSTPLQAIRARAPTGTEIRYARGAGFVPEHFTAIPAGELRDARTGARGLRGEYFLGIEPNGTPALVRVDEQVSFDWAGGSPDPSLPQDRFSVRWSGELAPTTSGNYLLGVTADDGVRIRLDGKLVVDQWRDQGAARHSVPVRLEAGKRYPIVVEYYENGGAATARLEWSTRSGSEAHAETLRAEAAQAVRDSDLALVFLGLTAEQENEGLDRERIELPGHQLRLFRELAATGKPLVTVLLSGGPLAVPEVVEGSQALLQAWYPGEAGGTAVARALWGDVNPSGKLPVTFYRSTSDLPDFDRYEMRGRTYRYFRGEPLFPFGYGLSYAEFKYSGLRVLSPSPRTDGDLVVEVEVASSGAFAGEEVVQLYWSPLAADASQPLRSLRAFRRVALKPGESSRVTLPLSPKDMSWVDSEGVRRVSPGSYLISVGGELQVVELQGPSLRLP